MKKEERFLHLSEIQDSWTYIWIYNEEFDEVTLHECYGSSDSAQVRWTENPVTPVADPEILHHIAELLEEDVIFTEEELIEYNSPVHH